MEERTDRQTNEQAKMFQEMLPILKSDNGSPCVCSKLLPPAPYSQSSGSVERIEKIVMMIRIMILNKEDHLMQVLLFYAERQTKVYALEDTLQ